MSTPKLINMINSLSSIGGPTSKELSVDDIYTKEEVNNLIMNHNHDHMYVSVEQFELIMDLFTNNDYGMLFEPQEEGGFK